MYSHRTGRAALWLDRAGERRFEQMDCLSEQTQLLLLVAEVHATHALVDIGGSRAAAAVAAVVTALQRARVPNIFIKCEALLDSALAHMLCVESVSASADQARSSGGGARAPAKRAQTECTCEAAGDSSAAAARVGDAGDGGAAAEQQELLLGPAKRVREAALRPLQPRHALWRWRKRNMPRAWDTAQAEAVRRQGLVSEGLAVVARGAEWWQQQVRARTI
jgi:hypothetical protein